jgi:glycosyltransferase involved in cell wall biosynthesis
VDPRDAVLDFRVVGILYRAGMRLRALWDERRGRVWAAQAARLRALRSAPGSEHPALELARARQWLDWGCRTADLALVNSADNRWLHAFLATEEAQVLRARFAGAAGHHQVRLREPNDEDPRRQGNVIVLKRYEPSTGEKGVLLLKYGETLRRFPAVFDLAALASRYALILEPSSWGYEDPTFFLYAGADLDVVVQSPWYRDYHYLRELRSNIRAVRVGAGDWVDPGVFSSSIPRGHRRFDVVVVSSWSPWKRHRDLFHAAATLNRRGIKLRIALVGYPLVWDQMRIRSLLAQFGLRDQCTIFDSIPQPEVAKVVGDSESYVLLSRREGANKAMYEALFCDTPVLVPLGHRGVNTDIVRGEVGLLYEPGRLADAIVDVRSNASGFRPRAWADAHSGYRNATSAIGAVLKQMSERRGLPWTRDIVPKKNAPELRYVDDAEQARMDPEYELLGALMR